MELWFPNARHFNIRSNCILQCSTVRLLLPVVVVTVILLHYIFIIRSDATNTVIIFSIINTYIIKSVSVLYS